MTYPVPPDIARFDGFIHKTPKEVAALYDELETAMSLDDLMFCQAYFRDQEHRDPTVTEIRVIDTYWSDHCRHTTFHTKIEGVDMESGFYSSVMEDAYQEYLKTRQDVYGSRVKDICLMDLAV